METIFRFFASVFIFSILYSCGPVLYSNVGQNVPLFQEKGEFSGQVAFSGSDDAWTAHGIGIQGAYAVSDKVAAIGSFYSMKDDGYEENEWEGKGSYVEFGAGMYGGKPEQKFLYEAFLGLGSGSINNKSLINPGEYFNVKFLKPFIQPTVGFSTKYFDMALTPRISYLTYTEKNDFNLNRPEEPQGPEFYFENNNNKILFEPGIMLRGGFPGAKLELQYNYSTLGGSVDGNTLANKEFFSIGLRFLISERTTSNSKE